MPGSHDHSAIDLLYRFSAFLDAQAVPYALLGRIGSGPPRITGDVDIVVPDSIARRSVPTLALAFARTASVQLVQVLRYEQNATQCTYYWKQPDGTPRFLTLDLSGDSLHGGRLWFLRAADVLATRVQGHDPSGASHALSVLSAENSFLYYFLKKAYKALAFRKRVTPEEAAFLRSEAERAGPALDSRMMRIFTDADATALLRVVRSADLPALNEMLPDLHRRFRNPPGASILRYVSELRRRAGRLLRPTGIVVALLGPDGSGKSTLGENLTRVLHGTVFRRTSGYHLRPFVLPSRGSTAGTPGATKPHDTRPHPLPLSAIKPILFATDFVLGFWLKIRFQEARTTLVVFDRYYDDLRIDPTRYAFRGPIWLARFCRRFVPSPGVYLLLDAPAEVTHERKSEVPLETARDLRQRYLNFAREMSNVEVLDAEDSISSMTHRAIDAIMHRMSRRIGRRYS